MRRVCIVSGGITKFAKANLLTQEEMVKDAFDYAMHDLDGRLELKDIQTTICTYFSDHFNGQLLFDSLTQDYLAMCPKPSMRIEGGGATGGLGIRAGYMDVASGLSDCCLVYGFEKMSEVNTAKGNEFIALASDTDFDFPGGRLLLRLLRHHGPAPHARVRHHGPPARRHRRQELRERFP